MILPLPRGGFLLFPRDEVETVSERLVKTKKKFVCPWPRSKTTDACAVTQEGDQVTAQGLTAKNWQWCFAIGKLIDLLICGLLLSISIKRNLAQLLINCAHNLAFRGVKEYPRTVRSIIRFSARSRPAKSKRRGSA